MMKVVSQILPDENNLFARIAIGDEAAFAEIFYHYTQRIYPFVLKRTKSESVTEEIVQEIFIKIWSNREKLSHVENYESYIFTIAANKIYNYFRKIAGEEKLLKELWSQVEELRSTTDEIIELKESQELINKAIEQLPPQRKKIYQLSRQEGLTHSQIAEQLNISTSTVNNQLTEALRFIKQYLQQTPEASLVLMIMLLKLS